MKMTNVLEKNVSKEITLKEKNNIVVGLREHLMNLYGTTEHYTFGEEDFEIDEAKRKEGVYCSVRRDPLKPRDLSGFCFRKDLLSNYLGRGFSFGIKEDEAKVYRDIHEFLSRQENIKDLSFDKMTQNLNFKIRDKEYFVSVYVGEGYADEIHVDFMKSWFSD